MASPWSPDDGPILPIEFSRIAADARLTLVIDEADVAWIPAWSYSVSIGVSRSDRESSPTRNLQIHRDWLAGSSLWHILFAFPLRL